MGILKYLVINTLIGEITIVWDDSENLIKQIILPDVVTKRSSTSNIDYPGVILEKHPNRMIVDLCSDIKDRILGREVEFDTSLLDLSVLTDFQKQVLLKQIEIPYGHVTTYKKLAEMIDRPRSFRPVANVLSNNPFPIFIPCHRTVRADWTVGGYAGTKDGYFKAFILENEGIKIKDGVVTEEYHYPKESMESENTL